MAKVHKENYMEVVENQTQRGARSSKQIKFVHGGQQKKTGKTTPSNVNNIVRSLTHGGQSDSPLQPSSMLFNAGAVRPSAQPSKHTTCNYDGGRSHVELIRKGCPTPGGNSTEGSTQLRHSQVKNKKENLKRNFMGMNKLVKNTCMISSHMLQTTSNEHETTKRQEQNVLTPVSIFVNAVLKNHPKEVH
ncbi:hypothetical protein Cgig2_011556 [Carnegiea gigantea]|uniref:Uncharacterized protein n=1 Tax=Carnegiea gigantea TaxID=171969 RepID=A0A9Q1GSL6_9CARY|nr:hypothetical protein Cgig2_011556 [Carnegiea gigantea]